MKPGLVTARSFTQIPIQHHGLARTNPIFHPNSFLKSSYYSSSSYSSPISITSQNTPFRFRLPLCASTNPTSSSESTTKAAAVARNGIEEESLNANRLAGDSDWRVEVGSPSVRAPDVPAAKLSLSDQAFFLLAFIACTTSAAFVSLVIAAVPTLYAMGRAAISLSKLADTAREELPSTMAAVRLSGMEISDLTLELSDLSQEIVDGVSKSAQVVQAAEAGIRKIGSLARQQTMSMIEERANLPTISLQPVVAGAAKKTSRAVGHATKTLMNMISGGEARSENQNENTIDRLDI